MKLADRIRVIAATPEYSEFAEYWRTFQETEGLVPGHAHRMIQLGRQLHQDVMRAAGDHAQAQVRSPRALTETQADQLIAEVRRGAERAMRKQLPELAAYADFVAMAVRSSRPPIESK